LGAVLYELAGGVHPFAGETPLDVYEAIECRAVAPLAETIPAGALILRMLDRDPALRPTAEELSKFLERT
jgi:serine/threonine protein kinase